MKKKIKLLALDLDGTLLDPDKNLTEASVRAVEAAAAAGVIVMPATGRTLSGIPREVLALKGIEYALGANGARVFELKTGRTVYEKCLSIELTLKIMDLLRKYDTQTHLYINGKGYASREEMDRIEPYVFGVEMLQYYYDSRIVVDDVRDYLIKCGEKSEKVNALFLSMDERQQAWKELEELGEVTVTSSIINNVEVNDKMAMKGETLLKFSEGLGIKRDEIMVCGDSGNDLDMIEKAGLSIAMENAVPEVKEAADYITASNSCDGVAKAIYEYVL